MTTDAENSDWQGQIGQVRSHGYLWAPGEWVPLLLSIGALSLVNLVLCPVAFGIIDPWPVSFLQQHLGTGLLIAQISLLNVALVLGSGPYWRRLVVISIAAVWISAGWYFGGLRISATQRYGDEPSLFVLAIAWTVFLSAVGQAPLWIARLMFGWRFVVARNYQQARERQFSLADFSAAMIAFSVVIGVMRMGALLDPGPRRPDDHWLGLFYAVLGANCFTLLFVMPLVGIFLSKTPLSIAWPAAFGFSVMEVFLLNVFQFGSEGLWLTVIAFSCAGAIGGACTLMRWFGVNWHEVQT